MTASLADIIESCMQVEEYAVDIYTTLAEKADDSVFKAFWLDIAADERRHVEYWRRLTGMEAEGSLRLVLSHPRRILDELDEMRRNVSALMSKTTGLSNKRTAIYLAARLESLMLNPSFAVLFRSLETAKGMVSPLDDYADHISKFHLFFTRHGVNEPGLQLVWEMLVTKWKNSMEIAEQIEQIQTLKGLLPICAGCHKIRDDDGYWDHVESYFGKQLDVEFSHSMCPDCLCEHYPEYYPKQPSPPAVKK